MIPVDRGTEPRALEEVRARRLPQAVNAFNVHGPGSKQLHAQLDGYDVAKQHLFLRQHKKCAYCERTPGLEGQPVEHFRPKKHASRRVGGRHVKDRERYWWLTWTWENLLFACATCNGPANKGNAFPLAAGNSPLPHPVRPASIPLPLECFALTSEQPLILDPADKSHHPLDHLRWLPIDRTLPRSLWAWRLHAATSRGQATKECLHLEALADDVDARYRDTVWPRFHREIERRLEATAPTQPLAAWDKLVRDLVHAAAPLAAATWSMLDVLRTSTRALRTAKLPAPPRP